MPDALHISQAPWLSATPTDWSADRLKDIVPTIVGGATPSSSNPDFWEDGDIIWVTPTDFSTNGSGAVIADSQRKITAKGLQSCSATLLPENTVIMASRATIGAARIAGCELTTNQGFISFTCDRGKLDGRFLYYVIEGFLGDYFAEVAPRTTFAEISRGRAKREPIGFPSLDEQRRIAAYLENACKAIDGAIDAKRKQLDTLADLRKSLIHKAVTRGLDDSVEMKPSGVDWFDVIPSHWNVDRLKDVLCPRRDAIKVGPFGSDLLLSDMVDEGIKVYTQRNVIDRDLSAGEAYVTPEKYRSMTAFTVYRGDLLVTTRGTIGRCVVVPDDAEKGILHPCLMRVQTNPRLLLPHYLTVLIQDCSLVLRQLQMMSAMTTIDVIYSESLKRTYLPLPPVEEQGEILAALSERENEIEKLRANIQDQLDTLANYRKSLIHECVTGKRRITDADIQKVKEHV